MINIRNSKIFYILLNPCQYFWKLSMLCSLTFTGFNMFFVPLAETPRSYIDRGPLESNDLGQRKACRFPISLLRSCSGESDPTFGFKDGKPCLIVKLNRIVNFRPKVSDQKIPTKGLEYTCNIIAVIFTWAFTQINRVGFTFKCTIM